MCLNQNLISKNVFYTYYVPKMNVHLFYYGIICIGEQRLKNPKCTFNKRWVI